MTKGGSHPSARWVGGPLGFLLRAHRRRRKISQADLAGRIGVSAKHLSFLETGRAKPSRDMVEWLARALELSDDDRGKLAEAAGFAGDHVPFERSLAPGSHAARDLSTFLRGLAKPSVVHDRFGTLFAYNDAFAELVAPFVDAATLAGPSSGHALLGAVAPHVCNWPELAWFFRRRVEAEILRSQTVDRKLVELLDTLGASHDPPGSQRGQPLPFWVPIELRLPDDARRVFRLATMTLGAPHDVAWRDVRLAMLLEMED